MTETSIPSTPAAETSRPRTAGRKKSGDDLTIVLFKDHYVPRTLKVPLAWIPRLGILLSVGGFGLVLSVVLAAQGWVLAWKAQPQRLRTLEDQIENLRRSNEALETELRALRRGEPAAPLLGAQDGDTGVTDGQADTGEKLAGTEPVDSGAPGDSYFGQDANPQTSEDPYATSATRSAEAEKNGKAPSPSGSGVASVVSTASTSGIPFLLPESIEGGIPAPSSLPFRLTPVQTETTSDSLNLKFALQYVADDGGNQQGRIVILGRAGDRFAAYPDAALSSGAYPQAPLAQAPLSPERGEFFSVSRYREVLGQLRMPTDARQGFTEVWVLIFSTRGKLLFSQKLNVAPPSASAPASAALLPAPTAKPAVAPAPAKAPPAAAPKPTTTATVPAQAPKKGVTGTPVENDISR